MGDRTRWRGWPGGRSRATGAAPSGRSRRGWAVLVPAAGPAAGVLCTPSATPAQGLPLRDDRRLELTELIMERQHRVAEAEQALAPLRERVEALTEAMASGDAPVREQRDRAEAYRTAA